MDGLVEIFNQTLKNMLRKTATEEGKDWDKLIPFFLFAYREVPQESMRFSSFELLYGRDVREPLDVLKQEWAADHSHNPNVISYHLMREKMEAMCEHVQKNLQKARSRQKAWYDQTAREHLFQSGEQVLILLPTSSSKLTVQWQGPYRVIKPMGKVNYLVNMHDRRKKEHIFHVNMLQKWHSPVSAFCVQVVGEPEHDNIPAWNKVNGGQAACESHLNEEQIRELDALLGSYESFFTALPGHTNIAVHHIPTADTKPVRLPPYCIPHAFWDSVRRELTEM